MGLKHFGENVSIYKDSKITIPSNVSIGNFVKIGSRVFINSASEIDLKDHTYLGINTLVIGGGSLKIKSFSGFSVNCTIITGNDDYSGVYFSRDISEQYSQTTYINPTIHRYVMVGANSVIMSDLPEGVVIGANSLVLPKQNLEEWCIYAGSPVRYIKPREKNVVNLHDRLKNG